MASAPQIVPLSEIRSSIGVGASQVAAILNLDPWSNAYEQWQIKTGRKERPPQTPAMLHGLETEPEAIAFWERLNGLEPNPARYQVPAVHAEMPFVRAIADVWCADTRRLVNVKCPSSRHTISAVRKDHAVPAHYLLQGACEMAVFGADEWEMFVYHAEDDYESAKATWETPIDSQPLGEFWRLRAVPEILAFWDRVLADEWMTDAPQTAIDTAAWISAMAARRAAMDTISAAEEAKLAADAEIKHLMGNSKVVSLGGWRAQWSSVRPSYTVSIKTSSEEKMAEVFEAVKGLQSATGIVSLESKVRAESLRFDVREVKK